MTSPAAPEAPRQHLERAWDMQDGLPDNSVNVILQTSDGYLWLGTDRGLVRFDGVDFDVFDTWNTPALHSDRISALCEDAPGSLWIGTKGGGVTHHRDGGFTHVGLSSQFINALCADGLGRVWVGTSGGGLFALRAGNFTASIVSPSENMLVADSAPKKSGGDSSSCWWPYSCMDPKTSASKAFEGVAVNRHGGRLENGLGVVVFNDGHSESRRNDQINPPVDPASGGARGLTNSKYWDPRQRAGNR